MLNEPMSLGLGEKPLVPAVYGHQKVKHGYHSYSAEGIWHYGQFE